VKLTAPLDTPDWLQGIQAYEDDEENASDEEEEEYVAPTATETKTSSGQGKKVIDYFGLGIGGDDDEPELNVETHHNEEHEEYKANVQKQERKAKFAETLSLAKSEAEVPDYETASNQFFENFTHKRSRDTTSMSSMAMRKNNPQEGVLNLPETEPYEWNRVNVKYKSRTSSLSTTKW
jgi:hypothetical protein